MVAFLGLVLIVASFLPWSRLAQDVVWTDEQEEAFADVAMEYHRLTFESAEIRGVSESEARARHRRVKEQFEAMNRQFERARNRPEQWSQGMRWSGIVICILGVVAVLSARS